MDLKVFTGDGAVDFVARVLSSYISGRSRDYVPVSPPSCSFQLDPNTATLPETGDEFAQHINQCLSDWIVENGVPQESDVQVTASWAPASANKSGFSTKATTNELYGVSMTDANTGTVVGDIGTIVRTTNGGATWVTQTSGTTAWLYGVSMANANTGTAVGDFGTILRTTDGGATWAAAQDSGTQNTLWGVSMADANTGTAVGEFGTIVRTTDGGATWVAQDSGTTAWPLGVSMTHANTGTAVGEFGTILRTTDGGATWVTQDSGTQNALYGVSMANANTGTAVGDFGTILRTTDGGATWVTQDSGTTAWLWGVSMADANTGTAVGAFGTIVRTTDGGANWVAQDSGTTAWLLGVSMTNANTGTAVGELGTILRTTDGGATWVTQTNGTTNGTPNGTPNNWAMNGFFQISPPPGCDAGYESFSIPLDLVTESEGIFGLLDCGTLNFTGEGTTSKGVEITGRGDIWDACGAHLSWAVLKRTEVPAGPYVITPKGVATDTMTVPVEFFEDDSELFFNSMMSETTCATDQPFAVGRAVIQWSVCGETPRDGMIRLVTAGTCKLALTTQENDDGNGAGPDANGVGPDGNGAEPVDVSGVWDMTATVEYDTCGGSGSDTYQVTIEQSGSALTVDWSGFFLSGTINGNRIDLSGTVPEGGSTTTVSVTLTVSADGGSMQGSDDWNWTDGRQYCSGSDSLSGTR
jgi:photosystem II stability/assembly factor-like uncharacterized protein